jgi:hypothetical protein
MKELGLIVGLFVFTLAFGALVNYCVPTPQDLEVVTH